MENIGKKTLLIESTEREITQKLGLSSKVPIEEREAFVQIDKKKREHLIWKKEWSMTGLIGKLQMNTWKKREINQWWILLQWKFLEEIAVPLWIIL